MKRCVNLEIIEYEKGNVSKAIIFFNKACDEEHDKSCNLLIDLNKRCPAHN